MSDKTSPTPTAMNAASPSDGDEARCWSDLVPCQKCGKPGWHVCRTPESASPGGEAAAVKTWRERLVNGGFAAPENPSFVFTGAIAALAARDSEITDLRAALAAKVERAAAPASVPEGAYLKLHSEMAYIAAYSLEELDELPRDRLLMRARVIVERANRAIAAAPEVAQPAAQRDLSVTNYGDAVDKSGELSAPVLLTDEQIISIGDKWAKEPGWMDFERRDFVSCVREMISAHIKATQGGKDRA